MSLQSVDWYGTNDWYEKPMDKDDIAFWLSALLIRPLSPKLVVEVMVEYGFVKEQVVDEIRALMEEHRGYGWIDLDDHLRLKWMKHK